ncbi:hypothetical protein [Kitasatospora sp. NPDC088783]|uniref:hypothetical protein n=1 Tax=Kitasatospora sp. NPDC088783 TaxID=3364077 RepID=UPI003830C207
MTGHVTASRPEAAALLAAALGGGTGADPGRFDVRADPDAGLAEDFIGRPVKTDAEGPREVLPPAVSRLPAAARAAGHRAVAACDFEGELPQVCVGAGSSDLTGRDRPGRPCGPAGPAGPTGCQGASGAGRKPVSRK